jgi:hypothetical protein
LIATKPQRTQYLRPGDAAPEQPAGTLFFTFDAPRLSDTDKVIFSSTVTGASAARATATASRNDAPLGTGCETTADGGTVAALAAGASDFTGTAFSAFSAFSTFAAAFGYIMTLMQIPSKITAMFLTLSDNRYVILMCINFMLLALGTLMDMAPLILILTPILLPVVTGIGVDPVHFGMIMLVNLGIGLITPPVGAVLFVGAAIGKVTIENTVKALLPFYAALFMVLMAVTYIPAISLWLPGVVL